MATATILPTQTTTWPVPSLERFAIPRVNTRVVLLVLLTTLALGVRVVGLATYGLSEDESNKLQAIEEYRQGHFAANAEHPMLMKLAMWGTLEAAASWNRVAPAGHGIPVETAIRLPNAAIGAATASVLFLLCELLFGTRVGIFASLFWALDVNAIAINRIGKEDTFLLFFFVLAIWCYERGKREGVTDAERAQRWYVGSGLSFGLMFASKYMPHYFGIYALFNGITDRTAGTNRPKTFRYYTAMAVAFVVANAAVLLPQTWRYCIGYVHGATVAHHGYLFGGRLYVNDIVFSPLGIPATFYLRMLATKVPVVVLAGAVAGVVEMIRRRHERGFTLLRVWLVFFFLPYSLVAAKFMRYALPMFAAIDVAAAVGVVAGVAWLLRKSWLSRVTRVAVAAAVLCVSIAAPSLAQQSAVPFYSLFRNAVGERLAAAGETFPEELYDYGVREAVAAIAGAAEPSAAIVSDAPGVVAHYLKATSRSDLHVRSLSAQGISYGGSSSWVIVEDEHKTFENERVITLLRQRQPWREFHAGSAPAAQVFHIPAR